MSVPELLQPKRTAIKNGRYAFFARRRSIKKAADGDDQKVRCVVPRWFLQSQASLSAMLLIGNYNGLLGR
jgi:hypothetical protein